MTNVRAALAAGAARLAHAGIESARLDARVLLAKTLGGAPGSVPTPTRDLTAQEEARYDTALGRRAAREPLAYVTGLKEFWSLDFEVGPGALVPRPETETLIEAALKAFPDRTAPLRILDLGTGTACLLITALMLCPNATGTGLDCATEALGWARRNLTRHGLEARGALIRGDWTAAPWDRFDLVFSNPPYLTDAEMAAGAPELGWEPAGALEAGPDGLGAYRALGPVVTRVLAPEGRAFVEIGAGQGSGASAALAAAGLEIVGIVPDLSGIPRCIVAGTRA